jgi:hypothetical protein
LQAVVTIRRRSTPRPRRTPRADVRRDFARVASSWGWLARSVKLRDGLGNSTAAARDRCADRQVHPPATGGAELRGVRPR